MTKKQGAQDEVAWREAKKICRLHARQIEMARRLGMNPKKLPGLRPSERQRWKLPVGAFIEACYRKQFGDADPHAPKPCADTHSPSPTEARPSKPLRNAPGQLSDLVCYFANVADDLEKWLAHGTVDSDVLTQLGEELREIAQALDTGATISPVPAIPLPPRSAHRALRRESRRPAFDDEIPF